MSFLITTCATTDECGSPCGCQTGGYICCKPVVNCTAELCDDTSWFNIGIITGIDPFPHIHVIIHGILPCCCRTGRFYVWEVSPGGGETLIHGDSFEGSFDYEYDTLYQDFTGEGGEVLELQYHVRLECDHGPGDTVLSCDQTYITSSD